MQTSFFQNSKKTFGPKDLCGKRKTARRLSSRHALHLVLRSEKVKTFGSFYKHKKLVSNEIHKFAKQFGVRVFRNAIAGNHLHLTIQIQNREAYTKFIQSLSGTLARKIMKSGKNFWSARPFTRILNWGRDYRRASNYVRQNELEAYGQLGYQDRNADTLDHRTKHWPTSITSYEEAFWAAVGDGQQAFAL